MLHLRWLRRVVVMVAVTVAATGCSDRGGLMQPEQQTPVYRVQGIPAGYYDTVDLSNANALRSTLHDVIDDHTRFPYTSTATDTWDILEQADEDPNDPTRILDIYRNASYAKEGGGNSFYNREHTWPKSYGYPNDNSSNYPYTDTHALFLCDDGYNSSRSNKPFRNCNASCGEQPTDFNNGVGGMGGGYPGDSNWTSGSFTAGTWETWSERKGDVARALLYLDVRYEGGTHGVTGVSEPDLILTDDEALIAASNTGSNESVGYMGMLTVLIQWHQADPVDDRERARNDVIYSHQGNRNPFVDHPEWVDCVFLGTCGGGGDTTPPAAPGGLAATAGDGIVTLDWADNTEGDLDGYHVYRGTAAGGPYTQLNGAVLVASDYADNSVVNGTTYYYVVTAVDLTGNESAYSAEASATPTGGGGNPSVAWINEFHYDNKKADKDEFVEVAGAAGTDLGGWTLLGYNGADGSVYASVSLSGTLPDQQGGFGTLAFAFTGLQNGSPDGIALVDGAGAVAEFLSYEGVVVATSGPAAGLSSVDVGVSEGGGTAAGNSLQRTGSGTEGADFVWQGPLAHTEGLPNTGQTFGSGGGDTTPPAAPTGLAATAGDASVSLDWADNTEPDLAGYHVYRSTSAGGPYTQIAASLAASQHTDASAVNGTTYYYVVTAVDASANESLESSEVSATPQAAGGGGELHVDALSLTAIGAGGKNERARATVTVVDAAGAPVSGVTVTGTFTGDIAETLAATTDGSGVAVLTTLGKKKGPISFGFCVDDAALTGWTYDSAANVVTCDGFGSS